MVIKKLSVFFLLTVIIKAASYSISVNQKEGVDEIECLGDEQPGRTPCRTLDYVYSNIISNQTFTNVNIDIHGNYAFFKPLFLNKQSVNISSVSFVGHSCIFISNISDAGIVIGEKKGPSIAYNLVFSNITFEVFGKNATSVILSWGAQSLTIESCIFKNNKCSALNLIDTNVFINHSRFKGNSGNSINKGQVYGKHLTFPYGSNSAGGAVSVIFSKREVIGRATFTNNIFQDNRAVSLSSKVIIDNNETSGSFSNIGGAMMIAFLDQSSYSRVFLENNIFINNLASLGGGIALTFHDTSGQNNVTIVNNLFHQNQATVSGGAFAISTWRQSSSNTIFFQNTNFTYNYGQVGAGGRILLQSYQSIYSKSPAMQTIKFEKVLFFKNKAASASALHINYNLGSAKPFTPVIFKNVTFANHTTEVYKFSLQGPSAFSGVLLSNRVDLEFHGDNFFLYNEVESSVFISNCEFYVKDKVLFYKNTVQSSGGALTMTDVSHLFLYPNAILQFIDNYAPVEGGALYVQTVGFPDMVYKYNPSCFIQYVSRGDPLPPSVWKVTVEFIKNGAGLKGAAIFANTITPCVWDEVYPYFSFKKSLHWKGFNYTGNYISGKSKFNDTLASLDEDLDKAEHIEIATDTIHFKLLMDIQNKTITAFPGEKIPFQIVATDELSNKVYSVPLASLKENEDIELVQKYFIFNPNAKESKGMALTYSIDEQAYDDVVNSRRDIVKDITFVDSGSQFISNATIKVKVKICKPGFIFKLNRCICNNGPGTHIVRCENDVVYLEKGYWGYEDGKNQLRVLRCPQNFCDCNQTDTTKLGCVFNKTSQCKPGRTGVLCGECEKSFGLDLMSFECTKCKGFSLALIILIIVAVLTVLVAILILAINPKFSTLLRSILFYVQMIPYVLDGTSSFNKVALTITGWLDVGGINSVPVKSCFMEDFNSMYAVALGYLYPTLILVVLIFVFVLHKFYWVNLKRSSPFQAFWILMVLMYKFLLETSLLLLFCVPIQDSTSERQIFYLDGSVHCYQGSHLTMTFIAALVILGCVLPPPILVALVVNGHVNVGPSIVDALSQGLGKHVRWWWSIDFLRRIVFISIYVFTTNQQMKQTLLTICCVITLSFHIQQQPYRNQLANRGESFLLLCLTIIVVIKPRQDVWDSADSTKSIVTSTSVIICITAGYCVIITLYVWIAYVVKLFHRRRGYTQIDDLDKDSGEDERYRESLRRRISGGKKNNRIGWLSPKMKKSYSDNIANRRCPSPFHTRSYLHDKI